MDHPPTVSMESLCARLLCGDEDARDPFLLLCQAFVRRRARAHLSAHMSRGFGASDVDDVTQAVMFALFADGWKVLRGWRAEGGRSLPGWIDYQVQRKAQHHARKGRRWWSRFTRPLESVLERAAPVKAPPLEDLEYLQRVYDRLVEGEPPRWRLYCKLWIVEGKTREEIADLLGVGRDAVNMAVHRIRKKAKEIRDELEEV